MQGYDGQGEGHPLKNVLEPQGTGAPQSLPHSPVPPPSIVAAANRTPPVNNGAESPFGTPSFTPSGRPPRIHKPTKSVDLQAVLSSGPHEMEAETHILRAVEKIGGNAHRRIGTENARLYATIANDEISRALDNGGLIESDDKPEDKTDGKEVTYARASSTDVWESTSRPPPGAGKANYNALQTVEASRDNDVTIEQTLFGFSNALHQMDQTSNKRESVMEGYDTPLKSADKLAATIDEHVKEELGITGDVEEGGMAVGPSNSDETSAAFSETEPTSGSEGGTRDRTKTKRKKWREARLARKLVSSAAGGVKDDYNLFNEFLNGKKKGAKSYAKTVVCFIILPSLLLSFILFYFVEEHETNPITNEVVPDQDASVSWWFLFVGVRLVITLTMALITQALVIDYLALGSRFSLRCFGPIITLFVVQSKGWPFISIFWGAYNLILLAGNKPYVKHWLYFQDVIGVFNTDNPGGNVLDSDFWYTILRLMIVIGVIVSIKRLIVGVMLGRQTFAHYGQELATVMKNMVLIGAVATLAKEIEQESRLYSSLSVKNDSTLTRGQSGGWAAPNMVSEFVSREAAAVMEEEEENAKNNVVSPSAAFAASEFVRKRNSGEKVPSSAQMTADDSVIGPDGPDGEFTASEQVEISELLDAWEEPIRAEDSEERKITIGAVMQFRTSLSYMKRKYPFLPAFGPANSRERCIKSSQAVFDRLMMRTPHSKALPFETLALLAKDGKGGINQDKAKELIRIFRPERDGSIGKLEFVKSVDVVYKQLRLLSANIANSSQIDKAIESLINIVFYVILGCYVIAALGSNPSAIFFSFSSVILGFAFMFGASSAKFFEGVLFILLQRPYGVGDRVHLSNPQNETSPNGSSCWIVEKVTLTTTTVYWGSTNERATLSNGAIADLRVINAARSPNATVYVELKFGIDTPYDKIAIFRAAVEQFLKERPREWLTFVGFRPTEVAVDRGFIGYKIIAQHRNHWQGVGAIMESKANLTTYCLEVAKQLEMRYHAPPLPVDLTLKGTANSALQALHGNGGGGLDQAKIAQVMQANKPRKGSHEAFANAD